MQFFIPLGAVNLLLVSVYLVPLWTREALRVFSSAFGGLHDRAHAAAVGFVCEFLGLGGDRMLVLSKLLAGFKLLIVAAMVAFLIEFVRAIAERREPDRATVNTVLVLAFISILTSALPALTIHDLELVQIYVAQIMLVSGAIIVTTVERVVERRTPYAKPAPPVHEEPVEQRLAA